MCGISGFVNKNRTVEDLLAMQRVLHHRGPDASGYFFKDGMGLAHNRLSIIDLSELANQPFYFEDLVLIFNGEIYNYPEIQKELKAKGYSFSTHSDTEVLLKGFHCWGPEVVHKLIGMFAFAIGNQRTQELYLFRDRLGVKPLFYQFDGNNLSFASELKVFLSIKEVQVDTEGLTDYLRFGYTLGERTFFRNVKRIPPGHYLRYHSGTITQVKYWDPCDYVLTPIQSDNEEKLIDRLEELMVSSFKYRMVSDVPVGIFFSGGIDSTALTAVLSKHYGTVNTFTIGFDDPKYDETSFARSIAKYFKTNHTEQILSLKEAKERLFDFYKIYDEPFYDSSGIPTSLVAQIAHDKGMKVVLSSEGGDELFAGYPSYQRYYNMGKMFFQFPMALRKPAGTLANALSSLAPSKSWSNKVGKVAQMLGTSDWLNYYLDCVSTVTSSTAHKHIVGGNYQPQNFLPKEIVNSALHPIELFMLWDLKYLMPDDFLVKIDRATMYHSVEAREPFLDHRLVEFSLQLPLHYKLRGGTTKYLLKKVLERYIPSSYFDRPKMGFSVPLFTWFKNDMDQLFMSKLNKKEFTPAWPQLDHRWIENQLAIYKRSKALDKELNLVMMWKFLGLMLWHEEYRK